MLELVWGRRPGVRDAGIALRVPVVDKWAREDGSFRAADFRYDADDDAYICPANKALETSGTVVNDAQQLYREMTADCRSCPLKPRCCPKESLRKIPRSLPGLQVKKNPEAASGSLPVSLKFNR